MLERSMWHPVVAGDELASAPLAVRLLGDDVVLWRDATGAAHAFADRCPHRGTKLSLGRVVEGGTRLECPYHGWQFAVSGQCVSIPALPAFTPQPALPSVLFMARIVCAKPGRFVTAALLECRHP